MANLKDIRKRITTVKNTQKITRVMTMISASKLHKTRQVINQSLPYHQELKNIFFTFKEKAADTLENFTRKTKEQKKIAILLLTSDRGLCGAFNFSLCKKLVVFLEGKNADLFIIGKKGKDFFSSQENITILDAYHGKKEQELKIVVPRLAQLLIERFLNKEYDEICLAYNYFVSSVNQDPRIQKILPIEDFVEEKEEKILEEGQQPAIFEPSTKAISQELIPAYLENFCYLSLLNSFAGEHAARMRVMDSATNNARDLITQLQMQYNRARQANITTELTEIISGAESV